MIDHIVKALVAKFEQCDHVTFYFSDAKDEPMRREVLDGDEHDLIVSALRAAQPATPTAGEVSDRDLYNASCLTRYQLKNWTDDDFAKHVTGIRKTLEFLFARLDSQATGGDAVAETCGTCMGSGYSNHPDSGEVCQTCNGQGNTDGTQPATPTAGCSCPFDGCAPCPACVAASQATASDAVAGDAKALST